MKQQKWNSKTTDLHGKFKMSFIKWENQVLKYIKRMKNHCQVPDLVQAFHNVEKNYKNTNSEENWKRNIQQMYLICIWHLQGDSVLQSFRLLSFSEILEQRLLFKSKFSWASRRMPDEKQDLFKYPDHMRLHIFWWGTCYSILSFLCCNYTPA